MMQDNTDPKDEPIQDETALDEEAERELAGVPEHLRNQDEDDDESSDEADDLSEALARLKGDLDTARQEVLYARAETQNVRRRMEKDIADTRAYAATGFARDILSVSDNLVRAIDSIPGPALGRQVQGPCRRDRSDPARTGPRVQPARRYPRGRHGPAARPQCASGDDGNPQR